MRQGTDKIIEVQFKRKKSEQNNKQNNNKIMNEPTYDNHSCKIIHILLKEAIK